MLTACLLAVGLTLLSAAPQTSPDFSGRWVLESPESAPPDAPCVIVVRSSRKLPPFEELTIHREFEDGVRVETVEIGILGGIVAGIPAGGTRTGKTTYRSVRGAKDSLVFESGSYTGLAPEIERVSGRSSERRGHLRPAKACMSQERAEAPNSRPKRSRSHTAGRDCYNPRA